MISEGHRPSSFFNKTTSSLENGALGIQINSFFNSSGGRDSPRRIFERGQPFCEITTDEEQLVKNKTKRKTLIKTSSP